VTFRTDQTGTIVTTLLSNFGGLTLKATCGAGNDIELIASTPWLGSYIASSIGAKDADFGPDENHDVMSMSDDNVVGTLVYHRGPNVFGQTVTVHWHAFENVSYDCVVFGIATQE